MLGKQALSSKIDQKAFVDQAWQCELSAMLGVTETLLGDARGYWRSFEGLWAWGTLVDVGLKLHDKPYKLREFRVLWQHDRREEARRGHPCG